MNTLFIGFGSYHGDDQAGWLVIDELSARIDNENAKFFKSKGNGLDWLNEVTPDVRVIFIDGIKSDHSVGQIIEYNSDELDIVKDQGTSSHMFPIDESIKIATGLGLLNSDYKFYGIVLTQVEPFQEVSLPIKKACENLVDDLHRLYS